MSVTEKARRYLAEMPVQTTEALAEQYPVIHAATMIALPDLTERQRALVIQMATDTCQSCYERSRECQCWNDE